MVRHYSSSSVRGCDNAKARHRHPPRTQRTGR
nr:MAG TPA: hypothetical protein [Caudoviricetes sp.]